jgi:hypothetical protein
MVVEVIAAVMVVVELDTGMITKMMPVVKKKMVEMTMKNRAPVAVAVVNLRTMTMTRMMTMMMEMREK